MATLVFTAIGTLIGGPIGGAIGALAGRQVDSLVLGGRSSREGPRLAELSVTTSSYGIPIARQFGKMRVAGQIIWATDLVESSERHGGGKGQPSVTEYSYSVSFAVALSSRPVEAVGRIWADGKLLRGADGDLKVPGAFRLYPGHPDQPVDPLLAAAETEDQCPAYTGLAYAVFEGLELSEFGNRIPALTFEVIADSRALSIQDIADSSLEDCDADVTLAGLTGLSMDSALVDTLTALDPLFPADCDASSERIAIRPDLGLEPVIALPEPTIVTTGEADTAKSGLSRTHSARNERPVAVLRYYDIDRDYQPGAQRATGRSATGQPRAIELPAAMSANSARLLIEAAGRRMDWSRQVVTWRMAQIDPAIRPGSAVRLPDQPGRWRVREWEWGEHGVDLLLVRLAPDALPSALGDPGRANIAPDVIQGESILAAYELPADAANPAAGPIVVAAVTSASSAWAGASLYAVETGGSLRALGPSGRHRAIVGNTNQALPTASPLILDRQSSVEITLVGGDMVLTDATASMLANGANLAVIGEEIIQFGKAVALGDARWRLSAFLRGRGGTEHAVAGHTAGERFVLMDAAGWRFDEGASGTGAITTLAAIGRADAAPVTAAIQLRGLAKRPLSPVHGKCSVLGNGDRLITWTRRARAAWLWSDGLDAPLNEQGELYSITFEAASGPLARWSSTVTSLTLAQAQLNDLRSAAPGGQLRVCQAGDRGLSLPLSIDLV